MVFVVGVGWQYGPGASGGSLGMGFWGVRRWGCGLGLDGVLVTLGCCSLWRRHAALLGMPVPADVGCQPGGRTVPGLVRGGGLGIWGRSASGLGLRLGLGAWVLVGVPPGAWVGACAWARLWCGVFDASVPPQGGGSNRGGVKRALPGCLIVLCSLGTDWMMGVG